MPVRSSTSSVLRWPDAASVRGALARWVEEEAPRHQGLIRLGYFGSYARGDFGVGSDLDLVAVVESSRLPFERRAVEWETSMLPVPAELLVYTRAEWERLAGERNRFFRTLEREAVWLLEPPWEARR